MEQDIKGKGEILRLENIEKVYPNGVMANKGINFSGGRNSYSIR